MAKLCREPGCGRVIANNARHGRCEPHAAAFEAKKSAARDRANELSGRNRAEVRRAMRAAIRRDGRCLVCGATERLQAHFLYPDQEHTGNAADYETRCASCHGKTHPPRHRR